MQTSWYYRTLDGSKKGPIPESMLKQLFSDSLIPGNTLVCRQNEDSWKEISIIPEFNPSYVKLAPPPIQISVQEKTTSPRKHVKIIGIILSLLCLLWYLAPIGINLLERLNDPIYAQVDDKLQQIYNDVNQRTGNTYEFKYLSKYWYGTKYQFRVYLFRATMGNKKDYGDKHIKQIVFVFTYLDKKTNQWKFYGEKFPTWPMIAHPANIPEELVETIQPENKLIIEEKEKFIQSVLIEPMVGVSAEEMVSTK